MNPETCMLLVILFILVWGWIIGYTIQYRRKVILPESNNMLQEEE